MHVLFLVSLIVLISSFSLSLFLSFSLSPYELQFHLQPQFQFES